MYLDTLLDSFPRFKDTPELVSIFLSHKNSLLANTNYEIYPCFASVILLDFLGI